MIKLKIPEENRIYEYEVCDVYEFDYNIMPDKLVTSKPRKKNAKEIAENIFFTFDIETTSDRTSSGDPIAFMYHFQIGVIFKPPYGCVWEKHVIFGRRFEEFEFFLSQVTDYYKNSGVLFTFWVFNLSFEFHFIYKFIPEISDLFARHEKDVIRFNSGIFQWRDAYALTNMSLAKACERVPGIRHRKKSYDLDYRIKRTPDTLMTETELSYCFVDVYALADVIINKLNDDTFSTMPYTSTGYVRRICRKACFAQEGYKDWFKKTQPDVDQYKMMIDAFRGGDTHYNRKYGGKIIKGDLRSIDFKSAYTSAMVSRPEFPIGRPNWLYWDEDNQPIASEMTEVFAENCVVMTVVFFDISTEAPVPYIPISKCLNSRMFRYDDRYKEDNGRILSATYVEITLTEIDLQIITKEYNSDGGEVKFIIKEAFAMKKGYISVSLRKVISIYFAEKTALDGVEEQYYYYAKVKEVINAIYGMCATHLEHDEVCFTDDLWSTNAVTDLEKAINDYYSNRNSFLPYQFSLYVTAIVRRELHKVISILGDNFIYGDTDSCKYISTPEIEAKIKLYNENVLKVNEQAGVPTYAYTKSGKMENMGIMCPDGKMSAFRSYGAKKYCYIDRKDNELHLTLAGVNKKIGCEYLKKHGGMKSFDLGFHFPPKFSGRTTATYIIADKHNMNYGGSTFTTAGGICIEDTSYTLGVTGTYLDALGIVDDFKIEKVSNYDEFGKKKYTTIYEREKEDYEIVFE